MNNEQRCTIENEKIAKVVAKVRVTGLTNMFDKNMVSDISKIYFDEYEISQIIKEMNSKDYLEILKLSVKY